MKTLFFCTCYAASEAAWKERYQRWLDHHQDIGLECDSIVLIDDASPYTPTGLDVVPAGLVGKVDLPRRAIIRFASNLGRPHLRIYPGWIRSFEFALNIAQKYGFDKIVHVESDSFLLSERIVAHINQIKHGWTAFWCPSHGWPETALQVICADAYPSLAQFRPLGPYGLADQAIEQVLPFTAIEKRFTGDRYAELNLPLPSSADYVVQADRTMSFAPPRRPARSLLNSLFRRRPGDAAAHSPLIKKTPAQGLLAEIDQLLAQGAFAQVTSLLDALSVEYPENAELMTRRAMLA